MFEIFETYLKEQSLDITADLKECNHDYFNTNEGLVCVRCMHHVECEEKEMSSYNNSKRTKSNVGIRKEIEHLPLAENIIEIVNELFVKTCQQRVYRGKYRKAIICACIFHAFMMLGYPQSFDTITKWFELDHQSASKGFKLVKMKLPETRNLIETPLDIGKTILKQLNIQPCVKFTNFMASDFVSKSICDKSSKNLRLRLCVLIFYFIKTEYKENVTLLDFSNKVEYPINVLEKNMVFLPNHGDIPLVER